MKTAEQEDKNKLLKIGAGAICVLLAVGLLYYNYGPQKQYSHTKGYFTTDDGATWFEDSLDNIPPYTKDGKQAVRVIVYTYANGSKTFPGYLVKFPDDLKKSIEDQVKRSNPPKPANEIAYGGEIQNSQLVKTPKSSMEWASIQSKEGAKALTVTAPDGSTLDTLVPTD